MAGQGDHSHEVRVRLSQPLGSRLDAGQLEPKGIRGFLSLVSSKDTESGQGQGPNAIVIAGLVAEY